jgi:hypothetical protein
MGKCVSLQNYTKYVSILVVFILAILSGRDAGVSTFLYHIQQSSVIIQQDPVFLLVYCSN